MPTQTQIPIEEIKITDRQRSKIEIDEEFITSVNKRLINPIVIRHSDNGIVLVAGHRRLEALRKGGKTVLEHNIHFRDFSDLSPFDAKIVELEENVRRADLPWRDHVRAITDLHNLLQPSSIEQTAQRIGTAKSAVHRTLIVGKWLESPVLANADGISHAYSILQVQADRKAAEIIGSAAQQLFQPERAENVSKNVSTPVMGILQTDPSDSASSTNQISTPPDRETVDPAQSLDRTPTIKNLDFSLWAPTYTGPKFNLIHCDFPYDIEYGKYAKSTSGNQDYDFKGFWELTDVLLTNLDRICSYSAHIVFWFSMEFYEKTRIRLESSDLWVHRHPLVWHKTDNAGIVPGRDNQYPRRVYETAFLCSRGKRSLVKTKSNTYGAPTATHAIHPSQKPEPMLNFFFEMLIDETTDFLDPTVGSGSSVRSAEFCGARSVLGLEINPDYAKAAEAQTQSARKMRGLKNRNDLS